MSSYLEEVDSLVKQAAGASDEAVEAALGTIRSEASKVHLAWSGSNIGYHAMVYYDGFEAPPAGRQFSREWGLFGGSMLAPDSTGWAQRTYSEVVTHITTRANTLDPDAMKAPVKLAEATLHEVKAGLESVLETVLAEADDAYLRRQLIEVQKVDVVAVQSFRRTMMPTGQLVTRDPTADAVLALAPHQEFVAVIESMRSPYVGLQELVRLGNQVVSHLRRRPAPTVDGLKGVPVGAGKVFIGHGRSKEWMALSAFVEKRLRLDTDEYNRIPTAGIHTSDRLQSMLDDAAFALLVLTGEDEQEDGRIVARLNVVHEVGLFQGRLGLRRAIVMLEDGCEEFSNIAGLGQIRFPRGNISAAFEEVREILEREGLMVSVTE
ncbi:TIR domain-containing protein [Jatrophihabitans lederbergiae]|uniref:Nucleotide-binding protein n=1 Tax=Jatrophihabitans lederbergiae TaxID=3075547 RepID=A0ABU2JBS0_9ACTN|nr:TIR domain-containing protein [Jatrophihabitans sp. DSM 44399]MDT0262435.1 nucleotide-binding protein [Jatrophihabitans sp. DSM 44399]